MELNAFITVFKNTTKKTVKIELKNCKSGLKKIKHFDKYVIFQILNMQPFQIRQSIAHFDQWRSLISNM